MTGRRPLSTLRARITAVATVVLAIVLAVAAAAIVALVGREVRDDLRVQNEATVDAVADRIAGGENPAGIVLPVGSDGTEYLIFDAAGRWLNATTITEVPDLPAGGPFLDGDGSESSVSLDVELTSVASRRITAPDGSSFTIEAVNTTSVVERSVGQVRSALLLVIPALTIVFAWLVWLLIGRTLRPVDEMTAMATRIRTETLHTRLEGPTTDDEIGRLAATLNGMLDRLERGAAAQRQFVSDASHELQSPLTVLLGEAELAAADPRPERLAAANALVVEHGQRMRDLIADLLSLARADEAVDHRRTEVDLDDVVRIEADLQPIAVDTAGVAPARVRGDERSLGRVVRNLLDNARHHGDGTVRVSLVDRGPGTTDGRIELAVADGGPGVPETHREAIFDRFARVDTSRTRRTGGTGLGLAIARAIVEAHDGTIGVEDAAGGGARFVVRLDPS